MMVKRYVVGLVKDMLKMTQVLYLSLGMKQMLLPQQVNLQKMPQYIVVGKVKKITWMYVGSMITK